MRLLVGHRGWERRHPGSAEYRLQAKHVYAAEASAEAFWRGAVLSLHGYCALEQVRCTVLNGDGAGWIRQGIDYLPHCEFQLDRWHLWQAVKSALRDQPAVQGQVLESLRRGEEWARLERILQRAQRGATLVQQAVVKGLRGYLWENRDGLREYRQRGLPVEREDTWRGLGAAEANVDKPWAERLTKRGMSWGRGLAPLVRLLSLQQQGTLASWFQVSGGPAFQDSVREIAGTMSCRVSEDDAAAWLQVRLPALSGRSTSLRRTLKALKQPNV